MTASRQDAGLHGQAGGSPAGRGGVSNVTLAFGIGAIALVIFGLALWQFRPF